MAGWGALGRICRYGEMMAAWRKDLVALDQHQEPPQMKAPKVGILGYRASYSARLARPGVIAIEKSSYGPLQIGKPRTLDDRPR